MYYQNFLYKYSYSLNKSRIELMTISITRNTTTNISANNVEEKENKRFLYLLVPHAFS